MIAVVHHITEARPVARARGTNDYREVRIRARHDRRLQPGAALLFQDVCDLAERDGFCSAGQAHFAEVYGTDERTIRRWERRLQELGYVRLEESAGDARRRRLVPTDPPDPVESTGHCCPVDTGQSEENTGQSTPEIPDNRRQAPRVYNSPLGGESGARAHEGRSADGVEVGTPTIEAVVAYAAEAGIPEREARAFFAYFAGQGWLTSGRTPMPITDWRAKLHGWHDREPSFPSPASTSHPNAGQGGGEPRKAGPSMAEVSAALQAAAAELPPELRDRFEMLGDLWQSDAELREALPPLIQAHLAALEGTPQ